ncbi:MAG TPA: hypothetical protein VEX68_10745 [Bryobacteraceae bacterium]|nr:hypothetical protein [Bryobacteraceae bacterium]
MRQLVRRVARRARFNHFALAFFLGASLQAENVILDCVGDGFSGGGEFLTSTSELRMPGYGLFAFRSWNVAGWRIDNATLFLHVAKGTPPSTVEVALVPLPWRESEPPKLEVGKLKFIPHDVSLEPQSWATVQIEPALIEELASGKAHGLVLRFKGKEFLLHSRESAQYAPKMYVLGGRR